MLTLIVSTLWRQLRWSYLIAKLEEKLLMTRWSIVVSEVNAKWLTHS